MKLNVKIGEKTFEVEVEAVEPETPMAMNRHLVAGSAPVVRVPAAPTPAAPKAPAADKAVDEAKVCRSPVSGIVVKVSAQVGQTIQTGDVLLVLEAMKMETTITAPAAGKIAAIPVNPGDSVQSGQVLVEFE